ncbi:MAG: protein kinase [Polyangiaceae bacterium]|nr:protein kinase [Polyangiaceae bacterium]
MSTEGPSHELYKHAQARVGSTLRGKWRLDELIGVGGMAAVYAATHRNGHRVAIKILHPSMALAPSVQERFLREGYTANGIDHPGIARVLDDDESEDGDPFLVMELLEGETLDSRWRRMGGRMPLGEVLAVGQSLLDILAAAHRKGILHRDIKPENVFLTSKGQLKLLDFGIARIQEVDPSALSVTRTGAALGTPAFMSPEQARGRNREVDVRSDLWAVGATLFALLTGRFVHLGETPNEVLIKTATEEAPPLRSLRPDLPAEIADILDRSLAFQPAGRWQDAASFRDALREASRRLSVSVRPPVGDPNARPSSFPDVQGATVESAPPYLDPPEITPEPAQISLPMTSSLPPRARLARLGVVTSVVLAIAVSMALLRPTMSPPMAPSPALAASEPAAMVSPALPSGVASVAPAVTAVEALPVVSAASPRAEHTPEQPTRSSKSRASRNRP